MASPPFHLCDLLALAIQDRRDADVSRRELLARDRPGGREATSRTLLEWIRRVDRGEARAQALSLTRSAAWGATLAGSLLGAAVAAAALSYDGSQPVNVLVAAFALAGVPLVFSGLSVIAMAWRPAGSGSGGPGNVGEPGGSPLTPGRWLVSLVTRLPWLPDSARGLLSGPLASLTSEAVVLGPTLRWWALSLSQVFGLGYAAAGLAMAGFLVVTRDLAFGWGSTLDLDPARVHAAAEALVWFAPGLCPDLPTVEGTRTFRADAFRGEVDAVRFTAWWPWMLSVQAVYGLLPRLLLAAVAWWRRGVAVRLAASTWPGAEAVLRRLREPAVSTRPAVGHSAAPIAALGAAGVRGSEAGFHENQFGDLADADLSLDEAAAACTLSWASAPAPADALPVGGRRSLDEDRATAGAAADQAAAADSTASVRVFVKAWEPPVLEFTDFLADLRAALGRGRIIHVVPRVRGAHAGDRQDVEVWSDRLSAAGDPWLRLAPAVALAATSQNQAEDAR